MNVTRARRSQSLLIAAGALVIAVAVTYFSGALAARGGQQGPNGIAPEGMAQIEALLREKETRTPAERKIDSQLLYARRMQLGLPVAPGVQTLEVDIPYAADGHAIVDVKARVTDGLMAQLSGLSGEIKQTGGSDLQLHVDLDQIEAIAAQPEVVFVQPRRGATTSRMDLPQEKSAGPRLDFASAIPPRVTNVIGTGAGSVTSQADITHRAAVFRGLNGADGSGVKIGVLSDGVTNLAAAQASGDLGPVTVLPGQTGTGDEGTAMLELIHDMAPGAQLYFATGFTSIASFAQNIRDLRAAGCDIIVDDVLYYVETPFQDGQAPAVVSPTNGGAVTQAVKDVTAAGAFYFSAAGNSGNLNDGTSGVWEGDFVDGGATGAPLGAGNVHNFAVAQPFDTLTLAASGPINLYWSDPLGASGNDYDIFRLNTAGTTIAASSTNIQDGDDDPYEQMTSSTASPRIVIVKKTGAAARFLHLNTNRGRLATATAGQIHGHAAASSIYSFGVAAVNAGVSYPNPFSTANVVETFSSDGPRKMFFLGDGTAVTPGNVSSTGGATLLKPDLTAADGVAVTGVGGFGSPFFGTSAAAPNAAAIMALFKSANPGFTQTQLRSLLLSSALDIEAPGIDRDAGVGIVMATPPQPVCTFTLTSPAGSVAIGGGSATATVNASSPSCNWVAWSTVPWINITGSGAGTGSGPLGITVAANHGGPRSANLMIQGGQVASVSQSGPTPTFFGLTAPVAIPDNGAVEQSLGLGGLIGPISNVTVSVYITHTFTSDLTISLKSPNGTVVPLAINRGSSGDNYGSACTPTTSRTTFDDSAANPISVGAAPFVGTFRPEQPLSAFNGTSPNGNWTMKVADNANLDTGTLQCWTLNINTSPSAVISGDFDGDVRADMTLYKGNGDWAILKSSTNYTGATIKNWGGAGYTAVPGDYDGDGKQDLGLYREATGDWFVLTSSTNYAGLFSINYGGPGYKPVQGDYDGDGRVDPAVYVPGTGAWSILKSSNSYTTTISATWGGAGYTPVPGQDFDGDHKSDIGIYQQSTGNWSILKSSTNFTSALAIGFGGPGYSLVPGDYDGDAKADFGVYDRVTGWWYTLKSSTGYTTALNVNYGGAGFDPVPGDYDGDGKYDVAVFQPATGNWTALKSSTSFTTAFSVTGWGAAGDRALSSAIGLGGSDTTRASDFDGDGRADITVYNAAAATWYRLTSSSSYSAGVATGWGGAGYDPVPGDFDGDGKADLGIYQQASGNWYVLLSGSGFTTSLSKNAGGPGWVPVAGDYDGDGKTDFAVYNTTSGQWFALKSSTGYTTTLSIGWGGTGYTPAPGDFDGDGKSDLGIYQGSTGNWYVLLSGANFTTSLSKSVGGAGYTPAQGDFDGDGKTDFVVYNGTTGLWYGLKSSTGYTTTLSVGWGGTGYLPVKGDYDGDGKSDLAIYQTSSGTWSILLSASGYSTTLSRSWGGPGYTAVPSFP